MTMLDRMRRHKNWLKFSLVAVVATFILLYIPSFLSPTATGAAPGDAIATVDGRKITVDAYRRAYQTQVQALRSAYGASVNEQMLRQLGIGQRVVQQLVDEEAVLSEARRIGISVSNAELRERLLRLPDFQENGQFVGEARYRAVLRMQRPPRTPAEFEEDLRKMLTIEKLQGAVAAWVRVTDAEVDEEYRRRNEKVKLDLAIFTANQFRAGITPTDAELEAQFKAHPGYLPDPRKAPGPVSRPLVGGAPAPDDGHAAGNRGPVQPEQPGLLHPGATSGKPHPASSWRARTRRR